ncbi:MAG: glycosyltransferase family 4 protein [Candidatus Omnitrophica bacterium]|nr:glycosyltransferase family 4 protein [Candidatus Omnitrophota bacterium]
MKNILYISYDGIEEPLTKSQVLPYLREFSKKGYKICLLTFDKEKSKDKSLIKSKLNNDGIDWNNLRYHKKPTLLAKVFDILIGFLVSTIIIRRKKINLVHARSYVSCLIAYMLKKFSRIPYIFDIRGLLADERVDSGDWLPSSAVYRLTKRIEKTLFKNADFVVVLTKKGKEIIRQNFLCNAKKIEVIPTCVDLNRFTASDKNERNGVFRLVYLGSIGTWYLLNEMLDFYATLKKNVKNAQFVFINQKENKEIIKSLGLEVLNGDDVEIIKSDYESVGSVLKGCTASIFFIKDTFSKKASLPTKFAESLAAGLPIVTNKGIGDLDDLILRYGIGVIVEDFNEKEYKKAISGMLDILKDRNEFLKRKDELLKNFFSLESGVKRYITIYNNLAK